MEGNVDQPQTTTKLSGSAIASLATGILSWLVLFFHNSVNVSLIPALIIAPISALLAVIFGSRAKHQIRTSGGAVGGKGMANAGLILGWIYLIIGIVLIVLAALGLTAIISSLGNL